MKDLTEDKTPIYLSHPSLFGNEQAYVLDCLRSEWVSTGGVYVARSSRAGGSGGGTLGGGLRQRHRRHPYLPAIGRCATRRRGSRPALTFIAPINAVRYVSAEPVFLDCDDYLNLDVAAIFTISRRGTPACHRWVGQPKHRASSPRSRASACFGSICDMEPLLALAAKYRLAVIEDATEALGSRMKTGALAGKHAGTMGDFGCYSFNGNRLSQAVAAAWLSPAALRSWPGPNI